MSTPLSDPSGEVCPDFDSPAFESIIKKIMAASSLTKEDAVKDVTDDWTKTHTERVAAFIAWKATNPEPPAEDAPEVDSSKKIPKVNDNLVVPTVQDSRPSSYGLKKLEEYAHIDLWYFTPDGCSDSSLTQRSLDIEGYGIAQGDSSSSITLKPLSSLKASSKAVSDANLSWELFELSSTGYLQAIENRAMWPKHLVVQQTAFFYAIKNHRMRGEKQGTEEIGKQVLLRYADTTRVAWHDRISRNEETFNIGIINEDRLNLIANDVRKERLDKMTTSLERNMASWSQNSVRIPVLLT
ncbi:hypothetical protein C8J56DRAFT_784656 [Mycena floridula]|nr:hypothetical protein C8J56DRAFT_784656 [Mycena floridula]